MNSGSSNAAETPVIFAEGLVRRWGKVQALDGLSFEVSPGEVYGLIGPDGGGKTTTMRILAGLIAPDSGMARVLGQNPLGNSPELRNSLGYMPQQYSLYGDLTVEENLRFFSRMFCLSKNDYCSRRERLLHITRLTSFTGRRADALSGGMYKKLALACALLPRPRLLLMDEPTNGVDPVSRRELWALLFELAAEGMAILVTTPYMDEAARCHRVGLIHHGKMLVEGAPGDLLAKFTQPVFQVIGGQKQAFAHVLQKHPGIITSSLVGTCPRLIVRTEAIGSLQEAIAQAGARLEPAQPDFEDLFLTMATEK